MKHIKTFENFINEAGPAEGPKVKKFFQQVGENTVSETIKDMEGQEEQPSDALYNAMKQTGCKKPEECIVVGEYHTDDWNKVLDTAKKVGLKYVEASDDNGDAIVFDAKQ
jgi:hypothetical protein